MKLLKIYFSVSLFLVHFSSLARSEADYFHNLFSKSLEKLNKQRNDDDPRTYYPFYNKLNYKYRINDDYNFNNKKRPSTVIIMKNKNRRRNMNRFWILLTAFLSNTANNNRGWSMFNNGYGSLGMF